MSEAKDKSNDNWDLEEEAPQQEKKQETERPVLKSDSKPISEDRSSREFSSRPPRDFNRGEPRRNYSDREERGQGYDRRPPRYEDREPYPPRAYEGRSSSRFEERDSYGRGPAPYDRRGGDFPEDRRPRDFRREDRGRFDDYPPSRFDDYPRDSRFPPRDDDVRKRRYDDDYRMPPGGDRFERDRFAPRDGFESRPKRMREDPKEPNETIGIFNLSFNLKLSDFEDFLAEKLADFKGKYTSKLIMNRDTGMCKGFGFVTFSDIEDAIKAKPVLDGGSILGQEYRAAYSIQRTLPPRDYPKRDEAEVRDN